MIANIWYDKLRQLPPRGSVQFLFAMLVWSARRAEEYLWRYALVTAVAASDSDSKTVSKAWEEFTQAWYPHFADQESKRVVEELKKMAEQPVLVVRRLQ